jgi:hypothetical protein
MQADASHILFRKFGDRGFADAPDDKIFLDWQVLSLQVWFFFTDGLRI